MVTILEWLYYCATEHEFFLAEEKKVLAKPAIKQKKVKIASEDSDDEE